MVREDPKQQRLLYVGTEFGLFASTDGGKTWNRFMNNMPTARVDDILVHPRDNDLIVATHARSVWIADDITALQQATAEARAQDAVLFDIRPAVVWLTDRQRGQQTGGQKVFAGENPPRGAAIGYYLKSAPAGEVKITIADATGRAIRTLDGTQARRHQPRHVEPHGSAARARAAAALAAGFGGRGGGGSRRRPAPTSSRSTSAGKKLTKPVTVLEDVWMREESAQSAPSRLPKCSNHPKDQLNESSNLGVGIGSFDI